LKRSDVLTPVVVLHPRYGERVENLLLVRTVTGTSVQANVNLVVGYSGGIVHVRLAKPFSGWLVRRQVDLREDVENHDLHEAAISLTTQHAGAALSLSSVASDV
jgi:uncharacterized membrane protein